MEDTIRKCFQNISVSEGGVKIFHIAKFDSRLCPQFLCHLIFSCYFFAQGFKKSTNRSFDTSCFESGHVSPLMKVLSTTNV